MKAQWSKLFVVTVTFVLLAGACAAPPPPAPTATPPTATPIPPTPTPDPAAPVKIWVDAINNGDTEAALALVSDDVKWQGSFEATGKEELRAVVDWMIGIESKPQITDCQPQSDRVVCNLTALDGCKAAFGASSLRSKLVFIFQPDGKVQQASLEPDGEEWAGYWSWLEAETAWAAANRAEEQAKVGTDPNQKEAGSIQIKLCKEYEESLKSASSATLAPKQVLLVAQEQSEDMELMLTKEVGVMVSMLEKAGYKVVVASASGQSITGGTTALKPDLKLADVKVDDYAGLVLPCMAVPDDWEPSPELVAIIEQAVAQGKPVAAQVAGVVTLAAAGGVNGKQYAFMEDLGAYFPEGVYKGTGVVQDGNIITSGTCPRMARETGRTDGTPELTQKFIDSLAISPKSATTAAPTPATAADPLPVIKAYQDAANRGDVDAAVGLFADRAIVMVLGGAVGRDEIRGVEDWQAGLNRRLEFTDCKTAGNTATCKGFWTDDCAKALGGLGVRLDEVTFKVNDGKIQNVYGTASDVDSARSDENGTLMIVWAQGNRPEDYAKFINPTTAGRLTRQNGQLLLQMCLQAAKDPLFLVELWGAAFKRDDLDGVMGLFVDNGLSFTMGEASGDKQVARDTLEYIAGFNGKLAVSDCKAKGQQVTCALDLVDDYCVKAEGLTAVHYQATFKFKDNRIQTLNAKMAAADGSAVSAFGDKLGAWATANRPDDWKTYQDPAAAGITPRQNGELVATLCKGYLDSQK